MDGLNLTFCSFQISFQISILINNTDLLHFFTTLLPLHPTRLPPTDRPPTSLYERIILCWDATHNMKAIMPSFASSVKIELIAT